MKRLAFVAIVIVSSGCENSSAPPDADPFIKAEQQVSGPFGLGGGRRYEGPVSQAPDWAKSEPPAPQPEPPAPQ